MRTTIHLSESLLNQVLRVTKARTVTQAIRDALEGFLQSHKRQKLIQSFGRYPKWNPDLKTMRKNRDLG